MEQPLHQRYSPHRFSEEPTHRSPSLNVSFNSHYTSRTTTLDVVCENRHLDDVWNCCVEEKSRIQLQPRREGWTGGAAAGTAHRYQLSFRIYSDFVNS